MPARKTTRRRSAAKKPSVPKMDIASSAIAEVVDVPAPDEQDELQCIYCGNYFERPSYTKHIEVCPAKRQSDQMQRDYEEALASNPDLSKLRPGQSYRTDAGIPRKVPYTRAWLERQCDEYGKGNDEVRARMWEERRAFWWVEFVPPPMTHYSVSWNGCRYDLRAGVVNKVPNVIQSIAMDSFQATQAAFRPRGAGDIVGGGAGQLLVGLGAGFPREER